MSIADPFTVVVINETAAKSDGDCAPQYAMKIALQNLRDRCTKLQNRISCLEEENLNLRISRCKDKDNSFGKDTKESDSFRNDSLWAKVSHNSEEKPQPLTNLPAFSKPSDDFYRSNPMSSTALKSEDLKVKEDSLEEISLRGSVYGRTGHSSKDRTEGEDLDDDAEYGEDNLESLDMALKDIVKKMKKDQEILKQQKEGLKTALGIFKKVMKENSVCKTCLKKEDNIRGRENKIVGTEESLIGRSDLEGFRTRERIRVPVPSEEGPRLEDRICPLCEKFFHSSTPFDTFNEHVLSHFVEEEDEDKISPNYEVVT